jgi:hypothetical protein
MYQFECAKPVPRVALCIAQQRPMIRFSQLPGCMDDLPAVNTFIAN